MTPALGLSALTPRQLEFVLAIADLPGVRQSNLAKAFGICRTRTFQHVRRLIDLGYVEADTSNGVRLTSGGRQRADALALRKARDPFSPEDST